MLVSEMLEFAARRSPEQVALVWGTRTWTFAELGAWVDSVAGGLAELTEPGDRVAVISENSPEMVVLSYAGPAAGTILTPLNYRLHPEEWAGLLAHCEPSVLVGERAILDRVLPARRSFPSVRHVVCTDDAHDGEVAFVTLERVGDVPTDRPRPSEPDVAWLLYTSGTTGRPKGAMLTHRVLTAGVVATALARGVRPSDVYLFPFPLCHVAAYNVLLFHLHACPVVLMRRFDAGELLGLVPVHGVTNVSLAPTMIAMLMEHPDFGATDLSTVRAVGYGASDIPAEVLRAGLERLGCDFEQGYGMTELAGNAAFLDAAAHRRAAGSDPHLLLAAGRPGPLVSVRVVDDEMRDVPVGEKGEIVVKGDQVTPGYWKDAVATAEAFSGGWLHTGDVGRFDGEGFLYVVDRKKDVIVTGGENVASREVEEVLHRHPGVREAAVVGVPHPTWGDAVTAVVVRREGSEVTEAELVALCREHLAGFKKPRQVVFVDELPRNPSGKVLKQRLRETLPDVLG